MSAHSSATLAARLWPALGTQVLLKAVIVIAASLLLWVSAKVNVPLLPVKMTMQLFVVLALGLALGAHLAGAAVLLYLAEGAAGLPVFTGSPEQGIGMLYMMGPTGGYLLGFLLAAVATGWLADRGWARHPVTAIAAALIGAALIYIPGLLWLGAIVGWDKPVLAWGLYPFLVPDLIKVVLAGLVVSGTWALVRKKAD